MAEITINQLIKIIIGLVVIVIVISGIYLFFKNYVFDFIGNLPGGENKTDAKKLSEVSEPGKTVVNKNTAEGDPSNKDYIYGTADIME